MNGKTNRMFPWKSIFGVALHLSSKLNHQKNFSIQIAKSGLDHRFDHNSSDVGATLCGCPLSGRDPIRGQAQRPAPTNGRNDDQGPISKQKQVPFRKNTTTPQPEYPD
jgi:hypothetical protein